MSANPHLLRMRGEVMDTEFKRYPHRSQRFVGKVALMDKDSQGRIIIPEGPHTIDHYRPGQEVVPTPAMQRELGRKGLELDSRGRPLHPWFKEMVENPNIGVWTGKGFWYHWGPNYTADAIVEHRDDILVVWRRDNGKPALPGGFLNKGETAYEAAPRETVEETGIIIPKNVKPILIHKGPV